MRNVLLTLFIVLCPLLGFSQATFLTQSGNSDSATANCSGNGCASFGVENAIRSASATPVTIQWKLLDKYFAPNWKFGGFCDNRTCWGADTVVNGNMFSSMPYDNNARGDVFHAVFDASMGAAGTTSWVKMSLRDPSTGFQRVLYFIGTKSALGVTTYTTTASPDNVVVYPIPAYDAVNVVFDESVGVRTIAVYNLIGKLMGPIYKPASNGSAKINIAEMPNGIYFLRMMDASGRVVATRRFTHQ